MSGLHREYTGLILRVFFMFIIMGLSLNTGFCEEGELNEDQRSLGKVRAEEMPETSGTPTSASDASFDKRLPPVLPGEIINDSGRKMKVWSTTGPVPVADAPEPWKEDAGLSGKADADNVHVIIDKRHGKKR